MTSSVLFKKQNQSKDHITFPFLFVTNKTSSAFYRAVDLMWAKVFRFQSKDGTSLLLFQHPLLTSPIPRLSQSFDLSLEGKQVLAASIKLGPQMLAPRSYPQCFRALWNVSKPGTHARSHTVSNSCFPQPRLAS